MNLREVKVRPRRRMGEEEWNVARLEDTQDLES
jgi:hypothetical protein